MSSKKGDKAAKAAKRSSKLADAAQVGDVETMARVMSSGAKLDLDVLVGIMLMPFMKAMKYLAVKFDNVSLDPQVRVLRALRALRALLRAACAARRAVQACGTSRRSAGPS